MTYSYNNKNKQIPLSEESVFSYLSANPNFLVQNHSLLKEISIPHLLDENIPSLIEHQVRILRDENNKLKNNIEENNNRSILKDVLRKNIFNSIFELFKTKKVIDFNKSLCSFLEKLYETSYVRLFIFNYGVENKKIGNIYFHKNNPKLRFMFTEILNRNKPLCSSLQAEQLQMLFSKDAEKIRSNLLLPIKQSNLEGLLALGSHEMNKYSIGEDLDLLVFASELAVFKLQNLLTHYNI